MANHVLQDQFVKVGSINTCYWSSGSEGSTVLLLHGLGASKENWRCSIGSLARSHRVYAVDLVGFGLTDKPSAPYSLAYFTQFIHDLMDKLDLARSSLIGNSLGGAIALKYALCHPNRVDKLVLADSGGLGRACHPFLRLVAFPLLYRISLRQGRRRARRTMQLCYHNPRLIADEDVQVMYQRLLLPGAQEALFTTTQAFIDFRGMRDSVVRPIVDHLHTIAAPTLIIWGKQDRVAPLALARVAQERIPNARLLVIEQCGHIPQLECPDEFNAAVLELLDKSLDGAGEAMSEKTKK